MAVLKVRRYGDPTLRRRATPVGEITPDIRNLVADMVDTMYDEAGIGLAAPQIGMSLRLIVVADDETREARPLVNPEIVEQGGEATAEEGCLSIPGVFAQVTRAAWVRVEAKDLEGRPVSILGRGLKGRVLQHEMDHRGCTPPGVRTVVAATLNVLFYGTPEFSLPTLEALLRHHRVVAVVTQPDRPAHRGQRLTLPPVKQRAIKSGLPVLQPSRLREPGWP